MKTCIECKYWQDDPEAAGTLGACFGEVRTEYRKSDDMACRHFEPKGPSE